MPKFLLKRLLQSVGVFLGVTVVIFTLLQFVGDPIQLLLGEEASRADIARMRAAYGLDRHVAIQYLLFLKNALRGDLGVSYHHGVPAMTLVLERVPATLELAGAAMLVSIALAIPLGVIAANRRGGFLDRLFLSGSLVGLSAPPFWVGIVFILVFGVLLRWLPTSGRGGWEHLVLPAGSLALYRLALFVRLVRSGMLDVLSHDYVRTARAKGLAEQAVIFKHALKNTLIPFITISGLQMGSLLAGAVVTERVFAWPGMGRLILDSIQKLDYPVVMCWALVTAGIFILINLLVDISYSFVDPRVRAG
ncbi:MAG: ABC transporter permease [Nitrospinota bacterium]